MTIDDYINDQGWDSAIAACTKIIDEKPKEPEKSEESKDKQTSASPVCLADAYCHRGYARCFVPAIEDLSMALQHIQNNQGLISEAECYAKRAYAYWLDANYERKEPHGKYPLLCRVGRLPIGVHPILCLHKPYLNRENRSPKDVCHE
jgi:hypothetical protein